MVKVSSLALLLVACFFGSVVSLNGVLATDEQLKSKSDLIGTENPLVARIACWFGLFICTGVWGGAVVFIIGYLFTGGSFYELLTKLFA